MSSRPRLAHVVLQTGQPKAMADFYITLLDGRLVFEGHGLTFITCDDEHHRIAFVAPPEGVAPKDPAAAGIHHTAFTYETLDDLLQRYEELAAVGIKPVTPIQHGVTTSLYYRDPDGNFVEIQVDNFVDPDDATAYMNGPHYDEDAVGPGFDVPTMIAARRAGATVAELTTREWAKAGPVVTDPMAAFAEA